MSSSIAIIDSPSDPSLDALCGRLAEGADAIDRSGIWPAEALRDCGDAGVFRWFLPQDAGGFGWSDESLVRGYLRLSAACLTTTFIITQLAGAIRRIAAWASDVAAGQLMPQLASGTSLATLGISHLTTSRRHLDRPVMRAESDGDDFILDGYSPWVTGAAHAAHIVTGATMDGGQQILIVLPTGLPGVRAEQPARLVALSASCTGAVSCDRVRIPGYWLLAGPADDVMAGATGAMTGGLQTSTLAVGLAGAAVGYLAEQAEQRPELTSPAENLSRDHRRIESDLLSMAAGDPSCTSEQLRTRANSLALRASQAALAAAKGAGYVVGHPAGRWCREALFFLVWSCPQPVMAAHLCELAGISD